MLVKVSVLLGGKTPWRRLFGSAPPVYSIFGNPIRSHVELKGRHFDCFGGSREIIV